MSQGKNKVAKKAKSTELLSHWPKLIEGLQFSSQEFYARVEKALADREVPGLIASRVDWMEGGLLSARREYLRLARERLVFDICAAPFGTGFFVSLWFSRKPLRFGWVGWIFVLIALVAASQLLGGPSSSLRRLLWENFRMDGEETGIIALVLFLVPALAIIVRLGRNLDDFLMRTPAIGYIYERYFRRITLYRIDQTCMYQQAVNAAVTQVMDEITKTKGIPPLSELERRPIFRDLFQPQGSNGHH
jgi:hypothetical protein